MIGNGVTRRSLLEIGGGAAAASLALAASPAAALMQGRIGVRASGQAMPNGVELPATPPVRKRPDSLGFAIVGLGNYALRQMMPRFAQAERAHVAAIMRSHSALESAIGFSQRTCLPAAKAWTVHSAWSPLGRTT